MQNLKLDIILGFLIFFCISIVHAQIPDNNSPNDVQEEPPKIGNFALPSSQQPGALVSFGENIIDQNQMQLSLYADDFGGVNKHMIDVSPSILYGITNNLSVLFYMPIAASFKDGPNSSSGLEDALLQFEYAYYAKQTYNFTTQATIVTAISFPTGSETEQPPTGFGSPSFFLGATFNRMYVDWFLFTSHGVLLATLENNTKFGNQFLYQAGFGRNIFDIGSKWIFAWVVEVDGQYAQKNQINGLIDPNSGGNVVYVTPSLWVSSKHLIIQPGVGLPVIQHLFGNQRKNSYLLVLNFSWTF